MKTKYDIWLLGVAIATSISYIAGNSMQWATLHGLFGWIYVIYFAITGGA